MPASSSRNGRPPCGQWSRTMPVAVGAQHPAGAVPAEPLQHLGRRVAELVALPRRYHRPAGADRLEEAGGARAARAVVGDLEHGGRQQVGILAQQGLLGRLFDVAGEQDGSSGRGRPQHQQAVVAFGRRRLRAAATTPRSASGRSFRRSPAASGRKRGAFSLTSRPQPLAAVVGEDQAAPPASRRRAPAARRNGRGRHG